MDGSGKIGIFDSGIGGLSVRKEIVRLLPHESVIYYGDGKNCPYGTKSREEVTAISENIVKFLIGKGAKLIVAACNTATADAIDYLRATYPAIPFVGMEPAVKPAALSTKSGTIGILATEATLHGRHFMESYRKYSPHVEIIQAVGEGFVELAECGNENSAQAVEAVRAALEPMLERGADNIVLGCTHYPFLMNAIREVVGSRDVKILDPAPAIALRVRELLAGNNMLSAAACEPEYEFYTASDEEYRQQLIRKAKEILEQ